MHRALPLVLLLATACGGDSATTSVDTRLLLLGDDMGPRSENVALARGSSAVMNALVTVNGTVLTEVAPGQYAGQLPAHLDEGDTIQVVAIAGVDSIVGTATIPRVPSLVVPINGTEIHNPTPIDFSWTDSVDPDGFVIGIQYTGGNQVASYGSIARTGLVITSRLPRSAGVSYSAYLYAYNDGVFTGSANPNSRMRVRQVGGSATLVLVQ